MLLLNDLGSRAFAHTKDCEYSKDSKLAGASGTEADGSTLTDNFRELLLHFLIFLKMHYVPLILYSQIRQNIKVTGNFLKEDSMMIVADKVLK